MSSGPSDDNEGGAQKTDKDNAKEDHSFVAMTPLNFTNLAGYADALSSKKEQVSIDDSKTRSFEEMKLLPLLRANSPLSRWQLRRPLLFSIRRLLKPE